MFGDRDLARLDEAALAKLRGETLGFVFQSFNLIDELTIQENVELGLAYRKDRTRRPPPARRRRHGPRRHLAPRQALSAPAVGRPAAARRDRARDRRQSEPDPRRRADRQPRHRERRAGDEHPRHRSTPRARRSSWSRTRRATPMPPGAASTCSTAASSPPSPARSEDRPDEPLRAAHLLSLAGPPQALRRAQHRRAGGRHRGVPRARRSMSASRRAGSIGCPATITSI